MQGSRVSEPQPQQRRRTGGNLRTACKCTSFCTLEAPLLLSGFVSGGSSGGGCGCGRGGGRGSGGGLDVGFGVRAVCLAAIGCDRDSSLIFGGLALL